MTEKVLKALATLGTIGVGGYFAKKWYEGKLDEDRRKGECEARNASHEARQKAWQENMEKDSEIINQSSHAKGRHTEFEGFTFEGFEGLGGFESESEPKWFRHIFNALGEDNEDNEELIKAYSKRYGYKDAYLLNLYGRWRGTLGVPIITDWGAPRESSTILHNMDIRYTLAREGYLIGCKDIAELMETKRAMDSWYLSQRARFLAMYDVSGWHYLRVCEQHYFRTHAKPHTLLELELKRERDALRAGLDENEAMSEELRRKFFTNAMALYELREKELLSSSYDLLYGKPSPLQSYQCWLEICKDIWEGRDFLESVEEQRRAKQSEADSKGAESKGDFQGDSKEVDSKAVDSKSQGAQTQSERDSSKAQIESKEDSKEDFSGDLKEDSKAESNADFKAGKSSESSLDSKNAQGRADSTHKALDTLCQSLLQSYCQRHGIESEPSKQKSSRIYACDF